MDEKGFNPQYDDNKVSEVIYVGKTQKNEDGSCYRKLEVLFDQKTNYTSRKNSADDSPPVPFEIKDRIILHESHRGQQKIHCWLIEDKVGKKVNALHISRRTSKGVYATEEVTLDFAGMYGLKCFLDNLFKINTTNKAKYKIPLSELKPNIQPSYSNV